MNIKSLLLGSAAALAAVSGAHAADAIVAAEPEPMEYVRVCDAFGTGYFYIPGTETCLKVGGYMRFDVSGGRPYQLVNRAGDSDGGLDTFARFMLNISTASDTEYGALKTYAEMRFNVNNGLDTGEDNVSLAFGYIDLAGFRVGIDESAFMTFSGYAGNVIYDDIIAAGPYRTALISYTYDAGNGFSGVISLEDDENATQVFDADTGTFIDQTSKDYAPNVVAGLKYQGAGFGINVVGGYDSEVEEGAIKARIDATFGGVTAFLIGGYSTDGDKYYRYDEVNQQFTGSVLGSNRYATWGGDWVVLGGFSAPLSEKSTLNTQVSYDDRKNFAAVANVAFTVVPGFVITPEVSYAKIDDDVVPNVDGKDDVISGLVRFQRSF
ncbi:porin [Rhizobium sp. CFBP 8762]|uniref:porin n=1 Tax=Rhizobium sp. CFBP 8762 TaxID=2775279 RepID=UPI0017828409|nr:porin [Rhizobium sp. CFBP 8762]MBD8553121.1 porin [Rhizobium sp. CFBP 8762]